MEEFKNDSELSKSLREKERREKERVEAALNAKSSQMANFQSRNKAAGMSASEKTAYLQDMQLVIFTMCQWKKYSRVESLRRMGKDKDAKRKKELVGVKSQFKNFAAELETSLAVGTPRVEVKPRRQPPTSETPAVEEGSPAPEQQPNSPDGE